MITWFSWDNHPRTVRRASPATPYLMLWSSLARRPPISSYKDHIVKNLCLLFANIPEVTIDEYGSLKSWICKASNELYWTQLIAYIVIRHASIPLQPDEWPWPQSSPWNHDVPPPEDQPFLPTPLRMWCDSRERNANSPPLPKTLGTVSMTC